MTPKECEAMEKFREFIGEDAISLAVAAPEGGMTQADTARIVDVVQQTASFTAEQIKIIEVS